MCGITGFIARDGPAVDTLGPLQQMTRALAHRGPDGEGFWQGVDGRVNLGHRRLAIIDLSPAGAQPMATADAEGVITYNGEIYNFPDLRAELAAAGVIFQGTSDTEVLLQALRHWGVEPALRRLNGMFAFAYWEAAGRRLWLARDRFGEKPLYYGWHGGTFLFGSELKAMRRHPAFAAVVDRDVLPAYLRFNYIPWPHSIYRGVSQLPPGHLLEVVLDGPAKEPRPYWQLGEIVRNRQLDRRSPEDPSLIRDLDEVLARAVRQRMVSDVPLGAFLSGGVDSSTIVALMQRQSARPVKTFTIGFWESSYNEAEDAARVARHLGTEHHEFYLSAKECMDVIAQLPDIYDEPFADSSQIPTALVSAFTRRHVTVALSGDSGDEMLAGYNRYAWSLRIWRHVSLLPAGARGAGRSLVHRFSPAQWDRFFSVVNAVLPGRLRVRGGGEKLHKFSRAVGARSPDELYRSVVAQWQDPSAVIPDATEKPSYLDRPDGCPADLHFVERMMWNDQLTYMTSDILHKVDRAAMASGLEVRVPFLDNELARFAWTLPVSTKLHRGVSKWPLRQVLRKYVPESLFDRPKFGFGIPIGDWLRGPLRDWAEDLLSSASLRAAGYFKPEPIRAQWAEHLSGRRNLQHSLWSVLMLQAWMKRWGG